MTCTSILYLAVAGQWFDLGKSILAGTGVFLAPVCLYLVTRRHNAAETARREATQVEQLYIGEASKLIGTLQDTVRARDARINVLDAEREQLRASLAEERQVYAQVKQRHAEVMALLIASGIPVPPETHV